MAYSRSTLTGWSIGPDGAASRSTLSGWDIQEGAASGVGGDIAVTKLPYVVAIDGSAPAIGNIAVTKLPYIVAIDGSAPAVGNIAVTKLPYVVAISGTSGSAGDIRVSFSIERERGATLASVSNLRWVLFNSTLSSVIASGTAATNASGTLTLDIDNTPYSVGDYVPIFVTEYDSGVAAVDRVVKTMFGFAPATAQP